MPTKILLVEDEAIIALSQQMILEQAGFEVIHNFSGEESVEQIKSVPEIALVLMDIDLGFGMDGTAAAKQILKIKEIPIIFLTSHTEREMVEKVKNITRYGYVIKDSGRFVLIEAISMAFNLFEAHTALKKSEIEYREIVDGAHSAIIKINKKGEISFFSKGAERILGFGQKEVLGRLSVKTINPHFSDDGTDHEQMMENIFSNPADFEYNENENLTKDGKRLWMRWYNKAVFDHNGNQMYLLTIGSDITEQRNMHEKLLFSEKLFHSAFSYTPVIMAITRLSDGKFLEINDYFIKKTGYTREETLGRTSTEIGFFSIEERNSLLDAYSDKTEVHQIELNFTDASGKVIHCLYSGVIFEVDGRKKMLSIAQEIEDPVYKEVT